MIELTRKHQDDDRTGVRGIVGGLNEAFNP